MKQPHHRNILLCSGNRGEVRQKANREGAEKAVRLQRHSHRAPGVRRGHPITGGEENARMRILENGKEAQPHACMLAHVRKKKTDRLTG